MTALAKVTSPSISSAIPRAAVLAEVVSTAGESFQQPARPHRCRLSDTHVEEGGAPASGLLALHPLLDRRLRRSQLVLRAEDDELAACLSGRDMTG